MAHRTFRDSLGRVWEVWPVTVEYTERREEISAGAPGGAERRRRPSFRSHVAAKWRGGWLAFETKGEKRRLAPFPADWVTKSDTELDALCRVAVNVKPFRRLIE